MRRVVAALTLAFVAFVHAADPVMCPDGCGNEDRPAQSASVHLHDLQSACLSCHDGVIAGSEFPKTSTTVIADAAAVEPLASVGSPAVVPIEHPPRA